MVYKETKEQVPRTLRKAIQTPFPSADKGGHARISLQQPFGALLFQCNRKSNNQC